MKILMVLTSHDKLGNTGRKTGIWLEEFAAPYYVFKDAGVDLTLVSVKGGQPPIDPKSDLPENQTPPMARFKQDPAAQKDFANTGVLKGVQDGSFVKRLMADYDAGFPLLLKARARLAGHPIEDAGRRLRDVASKA